MVGRLRRRNHIIEKKRKREIRRPREVALLSSAVCRKVPMKREKPWFGNFQ